MYSITEGSKFTFEIGRNLPLKSVIRWDPIANLRFHVAFIGHLTQTCGPFCFRITSELHPELQCHLIRYQPCVHGLFFGRSTYYITVACVADPRSYSLVMAGWQRSILLGPNVYILPIHPTVPPPPSPNPCPAWSMVYWVNNHPPSASATLLTEFIVRGFLAVCIARLVARFANALNWSAIN